MLLLILTLLPFSRLNWPYHLNGSVSRLDRHIKPNTARHLRCLHFTLRRHFFLSERTCLGSNIAQIRYSHGRSFDSGRHHHICCIAQSCFLDRRPHHHRHGRRASYCGDHRLSGRNSSTRISRGFGMLVTILHRHRHRSGIFYCLRCT